jgi:hypothetical protein
MEKKIQTTTNKERVKEPYHEPLLLKHEPLLDITGTQVASVKLVALVASEGPG